MLILESSSFPPVATAPEPSRSPNSSSRTCDLHIFISKLNIKTTKFPLGST
uniref:Uncharacterized protein n=1 Tax=Rhizophora mucronata TaxID=61149 RepID=A0A2P2MQA2_RHIMU